MERLYLLLIMLVPSCCFSGASPNHVGGGADAGNIGYKCSVSKEHLYRMYKNYISELNKQNLSYSRLYGYFTDEYNDSSIREIREATTNSDFIRKINEYTSSLLIGNSVRVVYSYNVRCVSNTRANLELIAINAFKYDRLKRYEPIKVTVEYKKQSNDWKIQLHEFDSRKSTKRSLLPESPRTPIDDFTK